MIHGKTKIELYNPNTKIKNVVKSENTFQNSVLAHQFPMMPYLQQNPFNNNEWANSPIVAMVGGLFLFKEPIQVGSVYMPAGNVMVGNASNGIVNTGNPNELGSYNEAESSFGDTSFTQVFDFTTAQANGNIACACLTSKWGGYAGYGNSSNTAKSTTRRPDIYHESTNAKIQIAENGRGYTFGYSDNTITVNEYRLMSKVGTIFTGNYTSTTHDVTDIPITGASGILSLAWHYVGNNKFAIIPVCRSYEVSTGNSFYWWEYDCATDTITRKSFVNSASDTISITASDIGDSSVPIFYRDGNMCIKNSQQNALLFFNTSNGVLLYKTTSNRYLPVGQANRRYNVGMLTDNLYIAQTTNYNYYIIDVVKETEKPSNWYLTFDVTQANRELILTDYDGQGLARFISNAGNKKSSYIAQNPMYLATINNLDSYVTKTAAQTMKVTYTLTEESEE